jgi:hypothetical protein
MNSPLFLQESRQDSFTLPAGLTGIKKLQTKTKSNGVDGSTARRFACWHIRVLMQSRSSLSKGGRGLCRSRSQCCRKGICIRKSSSWCCVCCVDHQQRHVLCTPRENDNVNDTIAGKKVDGHSATTKKGFGTGAAGGTQCQDSCASWRNSWWCWCGWDIVCFWTKTNAASTTMLTYTTRSFQCRYMCTSTSTLYHCREWIGRRNRQGA